MTRVGLVSDTHAPRYWKRLPPRVAAAFDGVDLVLHAGDVCEPSVLDELAQLAPVHVAHGNNDGAAVAAWGATEVVEVEVGGVAVAMVHDSGPRDGRGARLLRRFPGAALVVFGHSHIPWDVTTGAQRAVNPGSPTDRRRQPHGTVAVADLADGVVRSVRFVEVS
ncbi:metallophosphoesterase family protein [Jatrophihabitans sp. YIM 134969]